MVIRALIENFLTTTFQSSFFLPLTISSAAAPLKLPKSRVAHQEAPRIPSLPSILSYAARKPRWAPEMRIKPVLDFVVAVSTLRGMLNARGATWSSNLVSLSSVTLPSHFVELSSRGQNRCSRSVWSSFATGLSCWPGSKRSSFWTMVLSACPPKGFPMGRTPRTTTLRSCPFAWLLLS